MRIIPCERLPIDNPYRISNLPSTRAGDKDELELDEEGNTSSLDSRDIIEP
jgi:hypothetical protein